MVPASAYGVSEVGVVTGNVLRDHIDHNRQWSVVLLIVALVNGALVAILFCGGNVGVFLLLSTAMAISVGVIFLWYSSWVLSGAEAREPSEAERARLRPGIDELAAAFGVTPPGLMISDDEAANAFAIGRSPAESKIVFTTGILSTLDDHQLRAVAAHEMAHIANGDTRVALLSAALLGWALAISWIGTTLALAFIAGGAGILRSSPGDDDDGTGALAGMATGLVIMVAAAIAWLVIQGWCLVAKATDLAVHRQREYLADASSVYVTREPEALVRALSALEDHPVVLSHGRRLAQSLCVLGLPRTGRSWRDMMSTHPSTADRIERLRSVADDLKRLPRSSTPPGPVPTGATSLWASDVDDALPGPPPIGRASVPPAPSPDAKLTALWPAGEGDAGMPPPPTAPRAAAQAATAPAPSATAPVPTAPPKRTARPSDPTTVGFPSEAEWMATERGVFADAVALPRWTLDAVWHIVRRRGGGWAAAVAYGPSGATPVGSEMLAAGDEGGTASALAGAADIERQALIARSFGLVPLFVIDASSAAAPDPSPLDLSTVATVRIGGPPVPLVRLGYDEDQVVVRAWSSETGLPVAIEVHDTPFPARSTGSLGEDALGNLADAAEGLPHDLLAALDALADASAAISQGGPAQDALSLAGSLWDLGAVDQSRSARDAAHDEAASAYQTAVDLSAGLAASQRAEVAGLEDLPADVLEATGGPLPAPDPAATSQSSVEKSLANTQKYRAALIRDVAARRDDRRRARRSLILRLGALGVIFAVLAAAFALGVLHVPDVTALGKGSNPASPAPAAARTSPAIPTATPVGQTTRPTPLAASVAPVAQPTAAPVDAPRPTSTPSGPPLSALTSFLPSALARGCVAIDPGSNTAPAPGSVVAAKCISGGVAVVVELFPDVPSVQTAYAGLLEQGGIAGDTGGCWDGSPGERAYALGHVACGVGSRSTIWWTDERAPLLGTMEDPGAATMYTALTDWWKLGLAWYEPKAAASDVFTANANALKSQEPGSFGCSIYDSRTDKESHFDPFGQLGAIDCQLGSGGVRDYGRFQFGDGDLLVGWYQYRVSKMSGVTMNSGGCFDGRPGETTIATGRIACAVSSGSAVIRWINTSQLTYGTLTGTSSSISKLVAWWQQHGMR